MNVTIENALLKLILWLFKRKKRTNEKKKLNETKQYKWLRSSEWIVFFSVCLFNMIVVVFFLSLFAFFHTFLMYSSVYRCLHLCAHCAVSSLVNKIHTWQLNRCIENVMRMCWMHIFSRFAIPVYIICINFLIWTFFIRFIVHLFSFNAF